MRASIFSSSSYIKDHYNLLIKKNQTHTRMYVHTHVSMYIHPTLIQEALLLYPLQLESRLYCCSLQVVKSHCRLSTWSSDAQYVSLH